MEVQVHKVKLRGRQRWRARVTYKGETRATLRDRRADAWESGHALLAVLKAELDAAAPTGEHGPSVEDFASKEMPTFKTFWPSFMKESAAVENRRAEIRKKKQIGDDHLLPAFGELRLDRITTRTVAAYKAEKLETLAPATVANHVSVLKRALRVACDWNLIKSVPRIQQIKIPKQDFDFLNLDEAEAYLEATPPEWRTFVLTSIRTGMRQGELRGLQWGDVRIDAGTIRVARAFTQTGWEPPKSGKGRTLDLAWDVREALRERKPPKAGRTALVFPGPNGQPLDEKAIYDVCTSIGVAAGISQWCVRASRGGRVIAGPFPNEKVATAERKRLGYGIAALVRPIGPKALRHTYASHHAMRGTPLLVIQGWMGHADIKTTMRYAHLCPSTTSAFADNVAPNRGPRLVDRAQARD